MPDIRKDPTTNTWIIISTERGKRPSDFKCEVKDEYNHKNCPFCPGNEKLTTKEIFAYRHDQDKNWWVRGFPNSYPVLRIEGDLDKRGKGLYDLMNGIGAHEIIVDSRNHNDTFATMNCNQIEKIFWAYRDRIIDLQKDKRFRYILVFKNHGKRAGALTISHPHSQIIALPVVPKRIKEKLIEARKYYKYKERCIFCDIINQEKKDNIRIISENEEFIALSPYAPRFPFEILLLPKKHSACFKDIKKEQMMDLARITQIVFQKLFKLLCDPPFNYILYHAPNKIPQKGYWETIDMDFHWHFEIIPRITNIAGFEWGSGFYINPIIPEEGVKLLRDL